MPFHLAPVAEAIDRSRYERTFTCISTPSQHGKAISNSEEILTRRGWTTVGDVRLGDELVGSDGRWHRVTGVYPQGVVPLFRIDFTVGKSAKVQPGPTVCGEHLWAVRTVESKWRIKKTADLRGDLFLKAGHHKWRLPMVAPIGGRDADLPLDPYLLGYWLGNGTAANGDITGRDLEVIEAYAEHFRVEPKCAAGEATTYKVHGLCSILRSMGVLENKHVPPIYMEARPEQRLALLQGLGDSDGTVHKNGQASFTNTTPALVDAYKALITSLGGIWTDEYDPAPKITGHPEAICAPAWTIWFQLPEGLAPFRLGRKLERVKPRAPRNIPRRFMHDIVEVAPGPATCFTVDAPDHLFTVGRDLVLTHNTTLVEAAIVWLLKYSKRRHAYASYSIDRGEFISAEMQEVATRVGLEVNGNRQTWGIKGAGQLIATGIDGALTGHPVDGLLVIDDPIKNREDARSQAKRDQAWSFFQSTASTRLHPSSSILVVATRWHVDDLIGRISAGAWKRVKWNIINLPAILDEGTENERPLWPSQRPLPFLEQQKELLGSEWDALFMGRPVAEGQELFGEPKTYTDLPPGVLRLAFGVDLGYTAKTSADHSVIVKLAIAENGCCYVLDVVRRQVHADTFAREIESIAQTHPGVPWRWYGATTERGSGDLIKARVKSFQWMLAKGDKRVRALPVSAAWRAGKVLVPAWQTPWKKPFLDIVTRFTGVNDPHDDDVDALAAAYDQLVRPRAGATGRDQPSGLVQPWDGAIIDTQIDPQLAGLLGTDGRPLFSPPARDGFWG